MNDAMPAPAAADVSVAVREASLLSTPAWDDDVGRGPMKPWAYVFIATRQPKRVLRLARAIAGVIHADALLGTPDVFAIVEGSYIANMDSVIDRIAELPDVTATESKVARWIDGRGFPRLESATDRA